MKRGAPDHPKVMDLAHQLKVSRPTAIGYLELLWHFTAKYAPQGNIGKFTDERIEAALDWTGVNSGLIRALLRSHWLQRSTNFRLVVHDWHDHCDNSVKKNLQRAGLPFLSNQQDSRKMSRQNLDTSGQNVDNVGQSIERSRPSLSLSHSHSHTSANADEDGHSLETNGRGKETEKERRRWFEEEFWPVVWKKIAVGSARKAWLKKITSREIAEKAIVAALAQGPEILRRGSRPDATVLHPASWINAERWEDETQEPLLPLEPPKQLMT